MAIMELPVLYQIDGLKNGKRKNKLYNVIAKVPFEIDEIESSDLNPVMDVYLREFTDIKTLEDEPANVKHMYKEYDGKLYKPTIAGYNANILEDCSFFADDIYIPQGITVKDFQENINKQKLDDDETLYFDLEQVLFVEKMPSYENLELLLDEGELKEVISSNKDAKIKEFRDFIKSNMKIVDGCVWTVSSAPAIQLTLDNDIAMKNDLLLDYKKNNQEFYDIAERKIIVNKMKENTYTYPISALPAIHTTFHELKEYYGHPPSPSLEVGEGENEICVNYHINIHNSELLGKVSINNGSFDDMLYHSINVNLGKISTTINITSLNIDQLALYLEFAKMKQNMMEEKSMDSIHVAISALDNFKSSLPGNFSYAKKSIDENISLCNDYLNDITSSLTNKCSMKIDSAFFGDKHYCKVSELPGLTHEDNDSHDPDNRTIGYGGNL